eukprot:TRINITY_DN9556_c0_g1_i2.p1 TRINITY_DN9556_c0_g1~~TRINITY_DN9556_c0_g1_i2.p1  ORF type:complete len:229 (-),score=46.81 TRINITY_DN9556_c0_g1_i2:320-1006(-)
MSSECAATLDSVDDYLLWGECQRNGSGVENMEVSSSPSDNIELLKRRIEEQNQVIRKQNQEIKIQRKRNEELRKKLEVVEDYKLARIDENRARNFLGERLTYEDFQLIRDSAKFLALAKEEDGQDHLLVLTPTGVAYLKENFSINVNRYGKTRTNRNGLGGKVETFPRIHIRDIHRLDNRILALVADYFSPPIRLERKPRQNCQNYTDKAIHFGFRNILKIIFTHKYD